MKARPSRTARNAVALCTIGAMTTASAFQMPHRGLGRVGIGSMAPTLTTTPSSPTPSSQRARILLEMAGEGGSGSNKVSKRRRRKRKKAEGASGDVAPASTAQSSSGAAGAAATDEKKKQDAKAMAAQILAQEQMMYDEDDLTSFIPQKLEEDDRISAAAARAGYSVGGKSEAGEELEDLFDSREFLQRKREKQLEDAEKEGKPSSAIPTKKKIKRSDVKAYTKLLEMDPLADEDSSYFEDDGEIDFISALLGDVEPGVGTDSDENVNKSGSKVQKVTSFLGIGSGPLQVGHFIGALGVVLMAFVEYPGFPLTNLPDPLREALQGGLGTIYLINTILAVLAAISAPSRNQPSLLWAAKTFAVGGIAYDQLMQIPTPEELVERARKEEELTKRRQGRRQGRR
eukprot:CAMPEP_0181117370 /NCGR_PEP_ID=MMETSP1071-20121207/22475_1 /TAXON_ID=35127 /ORGANISM="Thalassiosira sp., Strain NH16" /LENGTH=400 /DNA_ID=CAMNT_0023201731 /DNA_START=29 /DNA_END=1231 /DNA_ORIENTATION=+